MRHLPLWLLAAVLIVVYCVVDQAIVEAAIVVAVSVGATGFAVRVARARRGTRKYWLIVLALGLWAAGWIGWEATIVATGAPPTPTSLLNLLFLGGSSALLVALVVALYRREQSLVGLLDVATIAAALLVVAWASLLHDYTTMSLPVFGQAIQIAHGTVDVLLVAAGLRLLVAPRRGAGTGAVLVASAAALVVSDLLWNWAAASGTYAPGSWADAGWLLWMVLGACAARQCSREVATEDGDEQQVRRRMVGRVALLAMSALVCPAVLLVEVVAGKAVDAVPLVVGGAVITQLVIAGLAVLARQAFAFHARAGEIASLVDSTEDAVIGTTPVGIITSWNRGAELTYGWKASETVGQPLEMIVPPATRGAVAKSMGELALGTTAIRHQASGLHRDGDEIDVALTVCPVFVAGRLVAVSTVARDISAAVKAEAERERMLEHEREQNEQLRELDVMKDEFVALVSHELRTPLTAIQGYTELVLDGTAGELNDEQRTMLGTVSRNSARLFRLINDLLFVAQVNAGKLNVAIEDVDLAAVAAEAVADARPRAEAAEVTLEFECDPVSTVRADRVRLAQVFDNLISNAIKFTPPGGRVGLSVSMVGEDAMIVVADSGMGMTPEDQQRLFTRFFRTKAAARIQGTGLGLSITKAILDAHNGSISVESEVGHGTRFTVTVPTSDHPPVQHRRRSTDMPVAISR